MLQEKLGKSALLLAAQNGQKEINEELIKEGADGMETDKVIITVILSFITGNSFYRMDLQHWM